MVFISRPVQFRGILDFPDPVQTKTIGKKSLPRALFPRLQRAREHQTGPACTQSARTYQVSMIWYDLFQV